MRYFIPTKIFFGKGELEVLATEKLPGKKALIVISAGNSMLKFGYLERVINLLKKNNTDSVVFDKILANPIKKHVMEGANMARAEKCDFIIGLGGGSSMDSAKSIAIMATNDGDYWDYIASGTGKGKAVKNLPLPIIAITTTAGTGTEADPWTVITNEETSEKIGYGFDETFPTISIVDPDLMISVPQKLTAYQGFDALFHATEGYIANIANDFSDMYALKAIELIGKYLPIAVNFGDNAMARERIALANTLSGMVESLSSCTSEHSIEHALSGYFPNLPHGAGLIMVSLEYYKLFADKVPERFINMAKALGKKESNNPYDFIDCLINLQKVCGVDNLKMSEYGIVKNDSKKYALHAVATMGGLFRYDRYKLSIDEVTKIIFDSYK